MNEKLSQLLMKRTEFVRSHGGYWEMTEFDQGINDINREIIAEFYSLYPDAWVGNINQNNNQPIMQKYNNECVYNFGWDFIIDKFDQNLYDKILSYNQATFADESLNNVYKAYPANIITFVWE